MGLSSALATAMSGLRANQAALSIVSSNIANAQTPGYVSQSVNQVEVSSGGIGSSVLVTGVNRELDTFVQSQLRTETAGGAYADQMSNILGQLQSVYGTPGGTGTLETALSNFTSALQAISTSSGSSSSQSVALAAAQTLAQQLNTTTQGIQALRSNVNQDIGNCVSQANAAMTTIANINTQLQGLSATDPAAATLEDQRDSAINTLSSLMDIRTVAGSSGDVNVYTNSGVQLVGDGLASTISFNSPGSLTANSLYSTNPAQSGVGSLTIQLPNGASTDMVATNAIGSGQIAADLTLRDQTLVQAQSQVDQLAATLSSSLSDTTTAGTAVTGPPAGFSVDTSNVVPGNTINLTYTPAGSSTQQQISIVNVADSSVLPLPNAPNANPKVIGVNLSNGMSSVVSQLNAALGGTGIQFSNPSGNTLSVVGFASATVSAVSTTTTASSLQDGSAALPLFTDGSASYTGAITASGSEMTGYAGRINVNPALLSNPSALSIYSTSPQTAAGDTTRSDYLFSQLTNATFSYSPQTGLGSAASPFTGTVTNYLQQFISQQGNAATQATQLQQGQDVVVSTLQQKFNSTAGVNIDTEMSNLIALQNAYAANAHVMSVVQSMMNSLLQAQL
ncbi:flagellar hook-associated protein FlgK [Bradyrhizobium canariense]|uniref:Flagellar hook-associated protein 1 n=1 Tax=Bradyrhizobium canariense TaxID=255045 RepID=A0A1H1MEI7_9BRAD|nr:flagellar hook-associated protein FlgK [Bradyrhizobium canariense]SDR85126.1 flagellar hook-associated protein 1 FlgK [Bradyrhizobium canariense]